jgi:hypothetical protein
VDGDDQAGAPGTMLPDSILVRVTDSGGTPLAGQRVEFVPNAPGAAVTPATSTTDDDGIAGARWVLGATTGAQELVARVVGAGVPEGLEVRFSASADEVSAAAPLLDILTQPSSSARTGEKFETQPVIGIRDADGDDLNTSGVAVTAAVVSGSGILGGTTTRLTDSRGRAEFTDLRIDGTAGSHTLIFAAAGYTSVVSGPIEVSPVAVQKSATVTRITDDEPDPSSVGQSILVRFTVSSDAGTPAGDVVVTVSGGNESCTGSVASGSCSLTLASAGERELTAAYGGNDRFGASSGRASHRVELPGVDQPPTAVSDEYTTIEGFDHTLAVGPGAGVLQNDRDPEGSRLTASDASDPPSGSVNLDSDGSFTYTPVPDFYGDDRFTYRASDQAGNSSTATVTIHVAPVNDPPAFSLNMDQVAVSRDAGPQSVGNFVASLSPGADNEGDQRLEFLVVGNSNPELFAVQPEVTRNGPQSRTATLSFTPASGRTGSAQVTIVLRDDGGTANGGRDTSQPRTFTISVD